MKLLKCELIKLKSSKAFLLAFILPLVMAIVGFINIYNGVPIISLWDAVYNQTILLYSGITFPLSIVIIICVQWRVEYKKNNILNLLSSPIKPNKIFISKIISTMCIAFINIIILIILLLIAAFILIPGDSFRNYMVYSPMIAFLCSIPFICLQHLLCIYFNNFFSSISMGIVMVFSGFILSNFTIGILLPNSYISYASFIGISNINEGAYVSNPYSNLLPIIIPLLSYLLYYLSNKIILKKEF